MKSKYQSSKSQDKSNNSMSSTSQNCFILGKFGKKTVVAQDLDTFLNSLKKAEWTTNPSYIMAKDINVKPTFNKSENSNDEPDIPKYSETVNKLYLHLNEINSNDFLNYIDEVNDRNNKLKQNAKKEKEEFMKLNFPNEENIDLSGILNKIKNNHKSFISKDQILFDKIKQAMNS